MSFLQYILMVTVCLGFFYTVYSLMFRKGLYFSHARMFLLAAIVLSLSIPLSGYKIDTGFRWPDNQKTAIMVVDQTTDQQVVQNDSGNKPLWAKIKEADPLVVLFRIYIMITALLFTRLIITISFLVMRYRKSYKVHLPDCVLLYNHGFANTISFFRWIFVQPGKSDEEDVAKIIAHEKIHVSQLHSADILVIELLSAVMWFNPFIWMIRNSMKLVHEYLADEGALRSGISIKGYQALLINQIAEERLVVLSSSFNHSLIKKRIKMMTKSKNEGKSPYKLLSILPVATFLFVFVAAFNGAFHSDANAMDTGTFSAINKETRLSPASQNPPPDTIIKKTIIKKISKENPSDTVIIEKEEIITGDDVIIEHRGGGSKHITWVEADGDMRHTGDVRHREMRVHVDTVIDSRHGDIVFKELRDDSVKHVRIVKRGGNNDISEDKRVIIVEGPGHESEILYIVDGEKMTDKKAIEILNPDAIQSVQVIKGDDAVKYGKKYSGVIIITTKKSK